MLASALLLFTLAILLGVYLLSFILQDKPTPKKIVFIHGPLATIALVILIIYAFFHNPTPLISIILFVLAALGGLMLIYRDLTGKSLPKWMAIGHGATATLGYIFLIYFMFFK